MIKFIKKSNTTPERLKTHCARIYHNNRLLPSSNIKCGGAVKQKNKRHIKNTYFSKINLFDVGSDLSFFAPAQCGSAQKESSGRVREAQWGFSRIPRGSWGAQRRPRYGFGDGCCFNGFSYLAFDRHHNLLMNP